MALLRHLANSSGLGDSRLPIRSPVEIGPKLDPAQAETLVCLWCSQLSPEREAELTVAPPCVRCGGKAYSSLTEGWLCQTCWQGAS